MLREVDRNGRVIIGSGDHAFAPKARSRRSEAKPTAITGGLLQTAQPNLAVDEATCPDRDAVAA